MAEIDYINEKCWRIKEQLPIELEVVQVAPNRFKVYVPAMVMEYDTFQALGDGHRLRDINVRQSCYDYSNGECEFTGDSEFAFDKWFRKYNNVIVKK